MNYKIGIIGCGRIASLFEEDIKIKNKPCTHAGAYNKIKNTEIIAACDIRKDRLERFSKTWGVKNLYTDYNEMLEKENLDIVSICTHAPEHKEICIKAAESGVKVIFCEKPMACSLKEAEEMIEACKKNNILLAINHTRRWDTCFQKIKEVIESNKIGKLLYLNAYSSVGLLNGTTHLFDLLRLYSGNAKWVQANIVKDESTDPGGYGLIGFENDVRCYINAIWKDYVYFGADIMGTHGFIKGTGMIRSGRSFEVSVSKKSESESKIKELYPIETAAPEWKPPLVEAIKNLINAVENNEEIKCTGEDGKAALEIALAFHESHNNGGKKVYLPLQNENLRVIPRQTSFTKNGLLEED